jgi:glycine oxidase
LMGALSENGLYVFNGLGSRGVLLAPYLSECLSKFFDGDETAIPAEASINRFIKR